MSMVVPATMVMAVVAMSHAEINMELGLGGSNKQTAAKQGSNAGDESTLKHGLNSC